MQMAAQNPKEERTLIIVKPDGVKRGLVGEIVSRIEQRGLKVFGLKMFMATAEQLKAHYPRNAEYAASLGQKTLATYAKYGLDPQKELGTADPKKIGDL